MEPFSALLAICAGNWPVSGEFPAQRPVTRSFSLICARTSGGVNTQIQIQKHFIAIQNIYTTVISRLVTRDAITTIMTSQLWEEVLSMAYNNA